MIALLLVSQALLIVLFVIYTINFQKKVKVIKLIGEAVKVGNQITEWLKNNVKDGYSVEVLNHQELLVLFKKDQDLYDRIVKLDLMWRNVTMPPSEMHKHLIELAHGKYKQTH